MFTVSVRSSRHLVRGAFLALVFAIGVALGLGAAPGVVPPGDRVVIGIMREPVVQSPQVSIVNMLRQRFETLMDGDLSRIQPNYELDEPSGEYAWIKEQDRTAYFRAWLAERGLVLESASAWFEVDSVVSLGRGSYRLEVTEHAKYQYRLAEGGANAPSAQPDGAAGGAPGQQPLHTFGSRTVHVLEAVAALEGGWKIAYDWYADPLGEGAFRPGKGQIVPSASGTQPGLTERAPSEPDSSAQPERFDREKAAEYALRYSGVRSLPGGGKYNRSFEVYSYVGGDCANFVSQVLAAGGHPQDWGWGYSRGGSTSWTCSRDLIWHLMGSGTGRRVYRGDFAGALLPLPGETRGAIGLLQPGDVIGYETGGEVSHVAVVAAIDPYGWPVIASHTADRLYFPWDLGWDQDTVFWFVHIVY